MCDNVVSTFTTDIECFKQRQSDNIPSCRGLLRTFNSMSRPTCKLAFHSVNHSRSLTLPYRCSKGDDVTVPRHVGVWSRGTHPPIFNRHHLGVSGQFRSPTALPPGQSPGTHCIGGCVGTTAGQDVAKTRKLSSSAGFKTTDRPSHAEVTLTTLPGHPTFNHLRTKSILLYW